MAAQINHAVSALRIRCREINDTDFEAVINLLATGFQKRPEHWARCLQRLSAYPSPFGFPKYGYVLTCNDKPVGVVLLIFVSVRVNGKRKMRAHVCAWYVDPDFRSYASILASQALRWKDVTYINAAPAPQTVPILDAQGYMRYSRGWFACVPALRARSGDCHVSTLVPETKILEDYEKHLLLGHAAYGCISVVCTSENAAFPFIFMRRKFAGIPFAYLVYCRSIAEFVRLAGPLGRFLAWRGIPLVFLDANGPIPGLIGRYFDNYPKYFKGPDQPRLGDLAFSELVMFRFVGERVSWRRRKIFAPQRGDPQVCRFMRSDERVC
jgi:hypothetical protein